MRISSNTTFIYNSVMVEESLHTSIAMSISGGIPPLEATQQFMMEELVHRKTAK